MKKIFLLFLFFAFLPLAAGQIIEKETLSPGDANCPAGGVKVSVGDDSNTDTVLDENEISSVAYICNGENGCNVVATLSSSSSYPECNGILGVLISSGSDCDSDGNIDDGEASETVLCRGTKGTNGTASSEGGSTDDGTDGANGKSTEFVITDEPAGENCAAGGKKVENRFDENGNGEFEDSEVTVKYICNGKSPKGSQGEQGSQGVSGIDGKDGADGVKGERGDQGEQGETGIAGETGENGADGYDTLISAVDEPAGGNCANGGKKFLSGTDTDRNGVLDESEVRNSYYICNGENAVEASESASSSGCTITTIGSDTDLKQIYSIISNIFEFVSNLF